MFVEKDISEHAPCIDYYFIKEVSSDITDKIKLMEGRGFGWFYFDELDNLDFGTLDKSRREVFEELKKHLRENDNS